MATPHRTDASFNFKSMKKGGKVLMCMIEGIILFNNGEEVWIQIGLMHNGKSLGKCLLRNFVKISLMLNRQWIERKYSDSVLEEMTT